MIAKIGKISQITKKNVHLPTNFVYFRTEIAYFETQLHILKLEHWARIAATSDSEGQTCP